MRMREVVKFVEINVLNEPVEEVKAKT